MAFMRYLGQGHEISVEIPIRLLTEADRDLLKQIFEKQYARLYSRVVPGVDIELLTWALLVTTRPEEPDLKPGQCEPYEPQSAGNRELYDPDREEFVSTPVFHRKDLKPGATISGPAVIVEMETTTIVTGSFKAHVDGYGYVHCTRKSVG